MHRSHRPLVILTAAALAGTAAAEPAIRPTEGYLPAFSRTVPAAERARIPLRVDYPQDIGPDAWPVTFGVPFPRGALASEENLRIVNARDEEVPAQVRTTATWHGPNGDVKWVLIDMTLRRDETYDVEFGTRVRRTAPVEGLRVEESAEGIDVRSDALRVAVSRTTSHPLTGVWLDPRGEGRFPDDAQALGTAGRMVMIDQHGRRFETSDVPEDYRVEIEEAGPLRATLRAEGWYRADDGTGLCRYVTRMQIYAGHPFVRMLHTFVVAFDSHETQLRDIAIPLVLAGDAPAATAVHAVGSGLNARTASFPAHSRLVQQNARRFQIFDGSGAVLHEGERAAGWVHVASESGGLAVGLKNLWQDFAKELEARPDGVAVHLWPSRHHPALDLSARGQLGPRYEEWDRVYHAQWYEGGLDRHTQALGLAKTNEWILAPHLAGEGEAAAARGAADTLQREPFVVADPAWMAASDAFGPIHARDPDRFPEAEAAYEAAFAYFENLRENIWNHEEHIGNYGFFDFGDVNYGITLNRDEERWEPRPWRRMASRFYGVHRMPWIQFARTGDRRFLEWAVASARHVMDIDMCHLTDRSPGLVHEKLAGGRYGGNGGIVHYAGNIYQAGPDSHVDPWMFAYYLTGYRRAWDVLLMEGEFYLDQFQARRDILRYAHRSTGGALRAMTHLWEATWDERYLDAAQHLAGLIHEAAEADPDGITRHDDVYMNPGIIAYYQATGDERMRDLLLRNMEHLRELRVADGDPRAYTAWGPTMAYYLTGDPEHLARPLFQLLQYAADIDQSGDPLWHGIPRGRWGMAHNTVQLLYGPYLLAGLATREEPVEPAPDYVGTSGEIWLHNPEGTAFEADVYWCVFSRPFHWGPVVREWPAYAHRVQPEGRLKVLDSAGRTVAQEPLRFTENLRLPYNSQDYPFSGRIRVEVPAGRPGLYRIRLEGAEAYPVRLALVSADGRPHVFPVQGATLSHGTAYHFKPPADGAAFTIRHFLAFGSTEMTVTLLDGAGDTIREIEHPRGDFSSREWTEWAVGADEGMREGPWRIRVSPHLPTLSDVLFRFEGIPPIVSSSPESFFVPADMPAMRRAAAQPPPPDLWGPVLPVSPESPLAVARGAAREDGRYERVDPRRGTIEFWIRPDWDDADYRHAALLRFGTLTLHRHRQLGTYLDLGNHVRIRSGFLLRPHGWYHVAVTWDLQPDTGDPSVTLFVDGVPLHRVSDPAWRSLGDWTGEILEMGQDAAMDVAGLRISAAPRDQALAEGILSPPPDEDTLYPGGTAP